jgi:hypothetical protein
VQDTKKKNPPAEIRLINADGLYTRNELLGYSYGSGVESSPTEKNADNYIKNVLLGFNFIVFSVAGHGSGVYITKGNQTPYDIPLTLRHGPISLGTITDSVDMSRA